MNSLKKCPYCGSESLELIPEHALLRELAREALGGDSYLMEVIEDYQDDIDIELDEYRIVCHGCSALSPLGVTKEDAKKKWNNRQDSLVSIHRKNGRTDYVKAGEILCS